MDILYWVLGLVFAWVVLDLIKGVLDDQEQDEIWSAISKINNEITDK